MQQEKYYTENHLYYTETMNYEDFNELRKSPRFKDVLHYDVSTTDKKYTVRFKESEDLIEDIAVSNHNKIKIIMYCAIALVVLSIICMITIFAISAKVNNVVSVFDNILNYQNVFGK